MHMNYQSEATIVSNAKTVKDVPAIKFEIFSGILI